jgi:putative aldouronate transport system permease protein
MDKAKVTARLFVLQRLVIIACVVLLFIPAVNPARISGAFNENLSLFTNGFSYSALTQPLARALNRGWVGSLTLQITFVSSLLVCLGFFACAANGCMSLGNVKLKKLGNLVGLIGCLAALAGCAGLKWAAEDIQGTPNPSKVAPLVPSGWVWFLAVSLLMIALAALTTALLPKGKKTDRYEMESKFKLFLLMAPFVALCLLFAYLPLWGWRFAFFDYKAGFQLTMDKFVGFKWFTYLFQTQSTRNDIVRVMKNTLGMSGLGLATSWCAMAFAIFLSEIRSTRLRRLIQTFTTIPNFISWVLVYAVAFAIFSTDGFVSSLLLNAGLAQSGTNYLMSSSHIWLKMLAWGMWKGLGWSAIIYIAAISGIDKQLYEAATVDGANRFQRMWHITVPSLMPTFMVLLLMGIAGILSNGLDQYLVFYNSFNSDPITVLDLYVYQIGINKGRIPLATVVGMAKTIVSVSLLFGANRISKLVRGENII